MSLSSKAAIVTGTANAGGIGFAIAKKLASLGYVVLGVDVAPCANPPPANSDRYAHYVGDVSSVDACRAIWNTFTSSFPAHQVPSIDCIVNNAAIANPYMPKGVQERFEQWQKTLNVNLTGPFLLTETLKPHLTPRASIVHISSTRALMSEPESEAYAATKAGLLGLAHAQAISLAGQARVNTILPGWINTGIYSFFPTVCGAGWDTCKTT
jgi:NAD(P)-dependent dehydrogenase (short-subunit alcohol dehydrogenase family)